MDTDSYRSLPIPQWLDLSCPQCAYPLCGLPTHQCPECGRAFDIDGLVTPTTPLRAPEITPRTRPVPNLGLECDCGHPLPGLPGDCCPECGKTFDLADVIPAGQWVHIEGIGSRVEAITAFNFLRSLGIPCLPHDVDSVFYLRGDDFLNGGARVDDRRLPVAVRRDYYLDALHALRSVAEEPGEPWSCPGCGEEVPGNFDICWRCQSSRG